jgi:hypothetical protein
MKRILLCTAAALMIAVTPAAAGKGGKSQSLNANVNIATGKGGVVGALLGTLKGHNGINVNANVKTGKGGLLGTILGGR